jgi:putative Mn2+ efflux pump MntP
MTVAQVLKIAAFVVPLGLDTFAVAVLLGLRRLSPFPPAVTFALFEAVMPIVGLALGYLAGRQLETLATVLGGLVLICVAVHLGRETLESENESERFSFGSLRLAAAAGFGVSMDELAIGFPMGTSGVPVVPTLAAIGVQTFVVTFGGILLGRHVGAAFGTGASRIAGLAGAAAFALLGVYLIAQRLLPGLPTL